MIVIITEFAALVVADCDRQLPFFIKVDCLQSPRRSEISREERATCPPLIRFSSLED